MKYSRFLAIATLSLALLSAPAVAQEYIPNVKGLENIPVTNTAVSLYDGGYDKPNLEVVVGYVNKSWRCTYPGLGTVREDFFGDAEDKFIHGVQIGALYTPSFDWGLGLRTGLFLEGYISRSKWIRSFCHHFSESDLYIPLHASYRIPLSDDCAFNVYGGFGFQWAVVGKYYKQVGSYWPWWRRPIPIEVGKKHVYGNGWPKQVNWQAECGLNFRIKLFVVNFTYSFGISEHNIQKTFDDGKTYITATKSRQDKMQVSIGVAF